MYGKQAGGTSQMLNKSAVGNRELMCCVVDCWIPVRG